MSARAWHFYLRPHRSCDVPAALRLLLAALSGAILSLSFRGSHPEVYSCFCVALLLSSIFGAPPLVGFGCGFVHAFLFVITCVRWIAETLSIHGGMSLAAGWGVLLLIATIWSFSVGIFGWAEARLFRRSPALSLVAAPFLWILPEVYRTYLPDISFAWALLGYPAAGNAALTQVTTVTGIWGLSFLIAALNALLLWVDIGPATGVKRRLGILAAVLAAFWLVQWIGPRFVPKAEAHHFARVIQPDFPEELEYESDWYANHRADMAELETLSLRPSPWGYKPDLLIWPEAPAPFSFQDPHFGSLMSELSGEFRHPIVSGIIDWKPELQTVNGARHMQLVPFNSAAMLSETGQRTFSYDKIHLVPFGEYEPFPLIHQVVNSVSQEVGGFHKGKERTVGQFANGNTFSVFICYEAIYPGEIRQFVRRGAQLLINISNDGWFGTSQAAEQHLRMARVRAVENRRWLLRDTNSGITASVDPYGNMMRVLRRDIRDSADLPYDFRTDMTFYSRFGDWFAWMCVVVSFILVASTYRKVK